MPDKQKPVGNPPKVCQRAFIAAQSDTRERVSSWNFHKLGELYKTTLTTLPPEVRNTIYAYALNRTRKITLFKKGPRHIQHRSPLQGDTSQMSPNLLRTCKQIHREARSIFYSGNHFIIPSLYLRPFLHIICFSTQHLTSVTFELNDLVDSADRAKQWHNGFVQLERLVGLQELKIRMFVHAEFLDVDLMVQELLPVVRNMGKARQKNDKAWKKESALAEALTFSVEVKPAGTWFGWTIHAIKADRGKIASDFRRDVLAKLWKKLSAQQRSS